MIPKYFLATYGCQMNEYDSNLIASVMERNGCIVANEIDNADYIIVNTCSVRGKAEENAYARIRQMKHLKRKNANLQILVAGCMARNHQEKILEELPHVDFVLGPDNYSEIEPLFFGKEESLLPGARVLTEFDDDENYKGQSAVLSSPHSTFISISRGCNKKCAYCIVPFVRGTEKYRDTTDIIREVYEAAEKGVTEVTLLGQTVNSWKNEGESFADLLNLVSEVDGIKRIRFTSPHPRHYTPELIRVLAENPKLCRHAHLPFQSGSDAILKKMRRQYTRSEFFNITRALREIDPMYGLTTDVIAGFVGETESDFQETLDLMAEVRFDHAFMFAYSPREGTEAFSEPETLSPEQKGERLQRMIDLQNPITLERAKAMLGSTEELLLEGASTRNPQELVGKTSSFHKVIVSGANSFKPGDYVNVLINDISGWTLRGEKC
jgi:tRNA-2-methylthio-N6-dimethylallyladenosine synthase